MNTATHSPGPWHVEDDYDGFVIIGRPSWQCSRGGERGLWGIATIDDLLGDHDREMCANADLIAAAPDMLAALQGVVKWADSIAASADVFKSARAAIAKASQP